MKFDAQNSNIEVIEYRSNSGDPGLFMNLKMAGVVFILVRLLN